MKVTLVAYTTFDRLKAGQVSGYIPHVDGPGNGISEMDELAEFAGRNCYQAWERRRPSTATNRGYLDNILRKGHFSVLEHASITFYVEGVSRSLLTELERHRFLSFSVISQRYVDAEEMDFVVPPGVRNDYVLGSRVIAHQIRSLQLYRLLVDELESQGFKRKEAREAARAVLPGGTEVKMVVTGNIRAWRDVIGKRYHEAADAEIREFATEVLKRLRVYCPNSVQDIPEEPYS